MILSQVMSLLSVACLKKIVAAIVSSKICTQCKVAEYNGEEPPSHVYLRNYDGSSKDMVSDAALHLYKRLFLGTNKKVTLKDIVADNDNSMRALLQHPDNNPIRKVTIGITGARVAFRPVSSN